ncbi:MAG TPA: class I SAM-dependent methyltransferase [Spirochaetota bacterium]|nr:class I SAM-dependent methyltransferase [Spirochaetota bacterium]
MTDEHTVTYFEKYYSQGFFGNRKHKKDLKKILNTSAALCKGKRPHILDIGFGKIDELLEINNVFPYATIVGTDIYGKKMARLSRALKEQNNITVFNGDINEPDFEADYFDFIFAFNVLYFADNLHETLKKIFTFLKKGGWFVFTLDIYGQHSSPNQKKYNKNNIKYNIYNKESLLKSLQSINFKKTEVFYTEKKQYLTVRCLKK